MNILNAKRNIEAQLCFMSSSLNCLYNSNDDEKIDILKDKLASIILSKYCAELQKIHELIDSIKSDLSQTSLDYYRELKKSLLL